MDEVDAELLRLALWSIFAAAWSVSNHDAPHAARAADELLAAAAERFPFLKPDPTGGLAP